MPISRSGSGLDPTKYTPIAMESVLSVTNAPTYTTILSVTGRGLLKTAVISSSDTDVKFLRVTIDGVVKHLSTTIAAANIPAGIFQESEAYYNAPNIGFRSPTLAGIQAIGGIVSYPYTGGGSNGNILLSDAIYFSKSLLVEAARTSAGSISYRIEGAYQP